MIVMHQGTVWKRGTPEQIFQDSDDLAQIGLSVPETVRLKQELEKRLGVTLPSPCLTIEQTVDAVQKLFSKVNAYDK
jgi:energy-coupling factor transport system ATP-binding protein